MPEHPIDDPRRWRQLTEEARTVAERIKNAVARKMMLRAVEGYKRLAEQAETRPLVRFRNL